MLSTILSIAAIVVAVATAVATYYAPMVAVRRQKQEDDVRARRERKVWIFKTLMTYRATRLNNNFVQALNMIDIEFTEPSDKEIRDSWKELLDHYTAWGAKPERQRKLDERADVERSNDLLAEMLVKMGGSLGYGFSRIEIKKGFYYPEGLGNIEAEQHELRRRVLALLSGQGMKLPVAVFAQDFQPLANNAFADGAPPDGLAPPSSPKNAPAPGS